MGSRRFQRAASIWRRIVNLRNISKSSRKKILLSLAICTALLAVTWQLFIAPWLQLLPANFSYEATIISQNNFYSGEKASFEGISTSNSKFSFKTKSVQQNLINLIGTYEALSTTDERVYAIERLYTIDRSSQQHVGNDQKERQGYLFAQPRLEKEDFTYWHLNYDQPAHMQYQATEEVLGLQTYKYNAIFRADQTKELHNLPDVSKTKGVTTDINLTLWVEPISGHLVKFEDRSTAYYYDLSSGKRLDPWNQSSNRYSFESIAAHAQVAEQERNHLILTGLYIPSALWVASFVFLAFWTVAAWRQRKTKSLMPNPNLLVGIVAAAAGGVVVLFGWAIESSAITRVSPAFASMHPLTAVNFVLVALVFLLWTPGKYYRWARIAYLVLAVTMLASSILYFLWSFLGIRLAVENILAALHLPSISNISPVTQLCFGLISGSVIMTTLSRQRMVRNIAQLLLAAALLLAVFAIAGYAFDVRFLYSIGWFGSISLHTAVLLCIIPVVLLGAQPESTILQQLRRVSSSSAFSIIAFVVMILLTGLAWQQTVASVDRQSNILFQSDTNSIYVAVNNELSAYIKALRGARGLFAASEQVTRAEWKAHVDTVQLQNYPGMLGIGFSKIVKPSEKAEHESEIRREGFSGYKILPEGQRDTYTSIIYLEPFDERNQRAFGYDMFSEPVRRAAMERARDTGEPAMTGHVTLVQETDIDKQSGMLIYLPVYRNDMPRSTIDQRRAALAGFVYIPLRMTDFMRATLGDQAYGIKVELFDTDNPNNLKNENLIYSTNLSSAPKDQDSTESTIIKPLNIAGHTLTLRFSSLADYHSAAASALPVTVLLGGILVSTLLSGFILALSSSRNRALKLANDMTLGLREERNRAVYNEQKNNAILSSIGDGVAAVDPNGKIILFNNAADYITRFPKKAALRHHYTETLSFYDGRHQPVTDFIKPAIAGQDSDIVHYVWLKKKDDGFTPVAVTVAPIIAARKTLGAVVAFRDITREKQLEQTKDEFLNIASHELRTPMGAIRAYISMILSGDYGPVNKNLREPLADMKNSAVRLVELVNDLLDVSRVETGRMTFALTNFDLKPALEEVEDNFRPLCAEKGLNLKLEPTESIDVQADVDRLKSVLFNIVGNAIKFTDKGDITIKVLPQKDSVMITVADTGIGISKKDENKIFGKFQQINTEHGGKPPGTGLGLYISRQMVTKMGGRLWIEKSTVGKGSTFAFTVPRSHTPLAEQTFKTIKEISKLQSRGTK